jgi:hypothetical protein
MLAGLGQTSQPAPPTIDAITALSAKKAHMPRKRPCMLRQSHLPKVLDHSVPHVPGVDRRTQYAIAQIELCTTSNWAAHGYWPGMTAAALAEWTRTTRWPAVTFSARLARGRATHRPCRLACSTPGAPRPHRARHRAGRH